jgi:hypothetical protein
LETPTPGIHTYCVQHNTLGQTLIEIEIFNYQVKCPLPIRPISSFEVRDDSTPINWAYDAESYASAMIKKKTRGKLIISLASDLPFLIYRFCLHSRLFGAAADS